MGYQVLQSVIYKYNYPKVRFQSRCTNPFTRILHFKQFLSKTNLVRFRLYLQKFSVTLYQETIPFERPCPFKDS